MPLASLQVVKNREEPLNAKGLCCHPEGFGQADEMG